MQRRRLLVPFLAGALVIFASSCVQFVRDDAARQDAIARQNNLGVAWLGQQNWIEAENALREGLAQQADEPILLINLSISLVQQGRAEEARGVLERALALDPGNLHARYDLGLLARSDGRLEQAIGHFEAVRAADPDDVSNLYNLAASLAASGEDASAESAFRATLSMNPVHTSANYGLGRLLVTRGAQEEGRRLIALSQELRARSGVDDSVGNRYGEQGYYALGVDWPAERVPLPSPAQLSFTAGPVVAMAGPAWTAGQFGEPGEKGASVVIATDERLIAIGSGEGQAPRAFGPLPAGRPPLALAAGDVTGDGTLDLVAVSRADSDSRTLLLDVLESAGRDGASWRPAAPAGASIRADDTADAPAGAVVQRAALTLVDRDHDGDLDAFVCWSGSRGRSCRFATHGEAGRLTFDSESRGIERNERATSGPLAISFCDCDLDRDIDMLVLDGAGVWIYANRRDGSFADVSGPLGLGQGLAETRAVDLADIDRDGRFDLLAASGAGVRLCRSSRNGPFECETLDDSAADGVVALDADGSGLLDVATGERNGPTLLLRNRGADGFVRETLAQGTGAAPLLALDLDGDLDPDLLGRAGEGLEFEMNDSPGVNTRLAVFPRGVRDNRFGIGTKVEAQAGAWRQRIELRRPLPVLFGTGSRARVDSVRLVWPGGVLQDEIDVDTGQAATIEQLDRKGTSCPLLYAWRGGEWRFVTDFLGGAAIGYRLDHSTFNTPDADEYVRIDGGLDAHNGELKVRLNNQLEEVIWFDAAELVVIDHPLGTEVYPHERLMPGPPWPEHALFASPRVEPVRSARVPSSGQDVTSKLAARDRQVVDGFALLPFKGYAESHAMELDLGEVRRDGRLVLLLDGWIDYSDSSANLAAAQAGVSLRPPRLLVPDEGGAWRVAIERMGFPAGLPKTMTVPLTGLVNPDDPRVRIETSMRIYWDRARVMHGGAETALGVARLSPREAVLRHGGLPRPYRPDGRLPDLYDPRHVDPISPWKAHAGAYTPFGDVRELLGAIDDAFVTTRSGDEIELSFDAPAGPGAGMTRTYLLYANGFGKDMDPASGAPETVGPLPWHGMPRYPYGDDVTPPARQPPTGSRLVPLAGDGLHGAPAPALAGRGAAPRSP